MHFIFLHIESRSTFYTKLFLAVGFACALMSNTLYDVLWEFSHYHLKELAFCFYLGSIVVAQNCKNIPWSKGWKVFLTVVFLSSLSTLFDEVFGDPLLFQLNDLFTLISIIIFSIYYYGKLH